MAGPKEAVNHLVEVEIPKHCEVQAEELESEGQLLSTWVAPRYDPKMLSSRYQIRSTSKLSSLRKSPPETAVRFLPNNKPLRNGASWRGRCQAVSLGSRIGDLPVAGQKGDPARSERRPDAWKRGEAPTVT